MLDLYRNIRELRKQLGLSQQDLADRLGYSDRSSIAKIESGSVDLPQSKIEAFAKVLGVKANDLMGWTDDPRPEAAADKTKNASFGSIASNLTDDESEALSLYRRLDPEDQGRVKERMETMLEADKYKKDTAATTA